MATLWFGRDSSMSQAWMSETCVLKTSAWKSTWPTSHVWLSMLYTTTSCVWIWAPWGNLAALATWASDGLELRNPAMVLSSVACILDNTSIVVDADIQEGGLNVRRLSCEPKTTKKEMKRHWWPDQENNEERDQDAQSTTDQEAKFSTRDAHCTYEVHSNPEVRMTSVKTGLRSGFGGGVVRGPVLRCLFLFLCLLPCSSSSLVHSKYTGDLDALHLSPTGLDLVN